ncbi:hypothetical protein [Nocardioides ungokensis]|uniref:hypothetical protein n=1 Tax=Nocardioides ungokensis TaxID=1643322 RepID=UPI001FE56BD7|nr:hypothetical protein [Nocardioides ungokensis]
MAVPRIVTGVIDRAIQVHGGMGVTDDTPLADMWGLAPRDANLRRTRRGAPRLAGPRRAGPGAAVPAVRDGSRGDG